MLNVVANSLKSDATETAGRGFSTTLVVIRRRICHLTASSAAPTLLVAK